MKVNCDAIINIFFSFSNNYSHVAMRWETFVRQAVLYVQKKKR